VRELVIASGYSIIAVRAFVVGVWPIGLIFATAAAIEVYWAWDEWKNNRKDQKQESWADKVVRLVAGKLRVVPAG
jgi:membrane glycosyltransferase